MILILADNFAQGRHYMEQMFPEESVRSSEHVRIATEAHHVNGLKDFIAIQVGTFPHRGAKADRLLEAVLVKTKPLQGPMR